MNTIFGIFRCEASYLYPGVESRIKYLWSPLVTSQPAREREREAATEWTGGLRTLTLSQSVTSQPPGHTPPLPHC